jgi:hypothetical protein
MVNCSIPNSTPANGRTSARSSKRSRKQNSQPRALVSIIRHWWFGLRKRRQTAALQSAPRVRKIRLAIRTRQPRRGIAETEDKVATGSGERAKATSKFQSAIRRVKGAWWPSRSSKPSLPRKWQGRFDSYPLRFIFSRHPERSAAKSKDPVAIPKADSSGFLDFARNDKLIEGR